jgi:hypothetical protein
MAFDLVDMRRHRRTSQQKFMSWGRENKTRYQNIRRGIKSEPACCMK